MRTRWQSEIMLFPTNVKYKIHICFDCSQINASSKYSRHTRVMVDVYKFYSLHLERNKYTSISIDGQKQKTYMYT